MMESNIEGDPSIDINDSKNERNIRKKERWRKEHENLTNLIEKFYSITPQEHRMFLPSLCYLGYHFYSESSVEKEEEELYRWRWKMDLPAQQLRNENLLERIRENGIRLEEVLEQQNIRSDDGGREKEIFFSGFRFDLELRVSNEYWKPLLSLEQSNILERISLFAVREIKAGSLITFLVGSLEKGDLHMNEIGEEIFMNREGDRIKVKAGPSKLYGKSLKLGGHLVLNSEEFDTKDKRFQSTITKKGNAVLTTEGAIIATNRIEKGTQIITSNKSPVDFETSTLTEKLRQKQIKSGRKKTDFKNFREEVLRNFDGINRITNALKSMENTNCVEAVNNFEKTTKKARKDGCP